MFMNFDGIEPSDLIYYYEKKDNKIVVYYFNGEEEYFDSKNEKLILQIQRDQMEACLNSLDCKYTYDDDDELFYFYKLIIKVIGIGGVSLSLLQLLIKAPTYCQLADLCAIGGLDLAVTIFYLVNNGYIKSDLKSLEKYKIYLENEDFFSKYNIQEDGIPLINPNTVDNFKSRQLKRVMKYGKANQKD